MSNPRPVVYIASAYTKGDVGLNVRFQCAVWNRMMNDKIVWPIAPLWSHYQHMIHPRAYQDWINYDLALLPRYDACLRLAAEFQPLAYCQEESSGADGEVAEFHRLGKPVFFSIDTLYDWAESWTPTLAGN